MDARHFDALARTLSAHGPRRGLLGLLVTLPVLGGLLALLDPLGSDSAGRRRRRKKRHKHSSRRRKHHKKCHAESKAKTCAGKCGPVKNNCQKSVDCGSCVCDPPCAVCFICNDVTGVCIPDAEQVGASCGDGQVCQSDGRCACSGASCGACRTCSTDGTCADCLSDNSLCENGACVACDVCLSGDCTFTSVGEAMAATPALETIRVCPGVYSGNLSIGRPLTLIGAGDGEDAASNTTLQGTGTGSVVTIENTTHDVMLRQLRMTGGGQVEDGGGVHNRGRLTLSDCTVIANLAAIGGAGIWNGGRLMLNGCEITGNASDYGGGIWNNGTGRLTLTTTAVTGNTAGVEGGGIFNEEAGTVTFDAASRVSGNNADPGDPGSGGGICNLGTVTLNSAANVSGNTPNQCGCLVSVPMCND